MISNYSEPSTVPVERDIIDDDPANEDAIGQVRRTRPGIRQVLATRQGLIGSVLVLILLFVAFFGRFFAPYSSTAIGVGIPASKPSSAHLFGTDELGRDVFSRFLTGGLGVVAVPLVAVTIAFCIGGTLGMFFGYRGGTGDKILTRVLDVLMPIPSLLVALLMIARFGTSVIVVVLIIAVIFSSRIARVMRGATQSLAQMEYVLAAEARGEAQRTVVFSEMLPNLTAPALVEFGVRVNFAIVFVASLNFLGLASQPPSSNWGVMAADGLNLISSNPVGALAPAVAIGLLVVGINLLTDSVAALGVETNFGWAQ